MSGIVSGITKVFSTVGQAAARVTKAVTGVGAATFTAGAATGAKSMASGGLNAVASQAGQGVLGRVLTGAIRQGAIGALAGAAVGAVTGAGAAKGAMMGGLGGAALGGLGGALQGNALPTGLTPAAESGVASAQTATGVAPTGVTQSSPMTLRGGTEAIPAGTRNGLMAGLAEQSAAMTGGAVAAAPAAAAGGGNGLLSFLGTETGGNVLSGLGQGAMAYYENQQAEKTRKLQAEEYDKQRADQLDREMRVRDSYAMGDGAYFTPPAPDGEQRPTPTQAWGRTRYAYDPAVGRIVPQPA